MATKLNDVLDTAVDAKKGYQIAAERIGDQALARYFKVKGRQRDWFAARLAKQIREAGEKPRVSGTWQGIAHREWIDLRAEICDDGVNTLLQDAKQGWISLRARQKDDQAAAVLEECLRGENHSKKVIEKAIDKLEADDPPDSIQELLEEQLDVVETTIAQMEEIKSAKKAEE